jgi:hypothetical protein
MIIFGTNSWTSASYRETTAVLVPAAGCEPRPKIPPRSRRGVYREKEATQMEPKRQNEIKLHMDKVSAFTVPTLNTPSTHSPNDPKDPYEEEDTDIVHWKAMDCTVEKVGERIRFDRLHERGGRKGAKDWSPSRDKDTVSGLGNSQKSKISNSYPNMHSKDKDSRRTNRVRTELLKESPNLRVAVKDFEVRASYTFWMDVTVKEANKMYVHRDRVSKDLVCSFLLELPELCLDITSSQFYIGINVIRNVLLAPPPEMAASLRGSMNTSEGGDSREGEQTSNKITEIFRDTQQLSPDVRVLSELNLKNRQSREEVKALIEEYFNRATEIKFGMARVVDLFIGKGTWILRSPPAATANSPAQSHEKVPTLSPSILSGLGKKMSQTSIKTTVDDEKQRGDKEREKDKEKEKEKDSGELLETGFTGVHATFTYNEDRYFISTIISGSML